MEQENMCRKALVAAFPHTIPTLAGLGFLGLAFGIYMNVSGFGVWYPALMSLVIYGGSLEFVAVTLLMGSFAPAETLILTLMIQARHLFFGIAMLDKYKGLGWKRFYLIFGLCDETFSINYTAEVPEKVDRGWFFFFVSLLNHAYWLLGSIIGGLAGSLITFNTEGLDFVMTAMFVVIFLERWLKEVKHYTALIGVGVSVVCLFLLGADSFMVPTMVCILWLLTVFHKPIERAGGARCH